MSSTDKAGFAQGMRDGIPIAMGYFAVAFSLGITARDCGFSPLQGFVASITTYASAGQYIGFTLYAARATIIQLIIMTIITNARYVLMGFALNQRLPENTSMGRRLITGLAITDEIFGITIARPGLTNPYYPFGAWVCAVPFWALGTALGISLGSILPARIVSALSVALFGMFLAVIIPASRKDRIVALTVAVSFAASYAAIHAPYIRELSSGNRTILLTVVISAAAAVLFPVAAEKGNADNTSKDAPIQEVDYVS
ncbi:MAG: AzlC family ABC transporter permease [Firmicutes bacterium]|nr:AzlC family ABC transporter permease [Bacillota bacterium]